MKTSNIDHFKRTSNFIYPSLNNFSSSNKIINLPKIIDTESIFCLNRQIAVLNDINEDNSYHKISSEITDHACDDIGLNLDNTEEEVNVTCIHSTNETNNISTYKRSTYVIIYVGHFGLPYFVQFLSDPCFIYQNP